MRTSKPVSVARFNSVSVIASGLLKLVFKSERAACRSASPNELMICSVVGVGEGDGVGDLAAAPGLLVVGAEEGAGAWPLTWTDNNIEIAANAALLNIASLFSCSPRLEQDRGRNDNLRNGSAKLLGRPAHGRL